MWVVGYAYLSGLVKGMVEIDVQEMGDDVWDIGEGDMIEEEGVAADMRERRHPQVGGEAELEYISQIQVFILWDIPFKDNEGVIFHEDTASRGGVYS